MLRARNPFLHGRRIFTGREPEETELESICFEQKSGAFGKEKTFLTQLINENAIHPATEVAGFLA